MNPNACLATLVSAIHDNDVEQAKESCFDLIIWLKDGGFAPQVSRDDLRFILLELYCHFNKR